MDAYRDAEIIPMVTKVAEVAGLVQEGRAHPDAAFARLRALAASDHWQEREVAATALVEIAKKQPTAVVAEMLGWATDPDPNIRRASCEGLRGLARTNPEAVSPILNVLRVDESVYVKKSVANLLRDASKQHPAFVLSLCRLWAQSTNHGTHWIIREELKKLRESKTAEVEAIVGLCQESKQHVRRRGLAPAIKRWVAAG